jgi:serine/threonine protein kinase
MVCGFLPFEDDSNDNEILYKKIISGKFSFPPWLTENCKDLIKKILTTDPTKRITIQGIKKHPWFNQINQSTNINKGLLLKEVIIPIDEGVINEMQVKYGFKNKKEIRECILSNRHNDITTIYYLIARKKVKTGYKSVVNLKSKLFLNYINDPDNLFEKYHYDINEVIACRGDGVAKEKMKNKINSKSVEKHSHTSHKLKPMLDNDRASRFNSPQTKTIKRSYINEDKDDIKYNNNNNNMNSINSNKKNKIITYNNITTSKYNYINNYDADNNNNNRNKLSQTASKYHHGKSKSLNKKGVSINLPISSGKKITRHLKLFSNNNNKTPINFNTGGNGNRYSKSLKKNLVKHYYYPNNNIKQNTIVNSDIDDNEETIIEIKQKQFEDLHRKIKTTPNFSPLKVQNQSSCYQFKSISQLGNSNSVLNYNNIKSIYIEEPVLVNLSCVSLKSKGIIKQNLIKVLNGMKVKFNIQSKTKFFVYGSSGDNLMVEINIVNVDEDLDMKCNSIKFKKRLGPNEGFNKLTRKILSKLDL